MSTFREITEEVSKLDYIQTLLSTYESIAALYMRRTKNMVVDSRAFYEGLRGIYDEVLEAHRVEIESVFKKRSFTKRLLGAFSGRKKQKDAAVLLSVNTGLYGDIVLKTLREFSKHVQSQKTDVVIMGKRGRYLFESLMPRTPYVYMEFPDTAIDVDKIISAADFLSGYRRVHVFYGKFESFVLQVPKDTTLGSAGELSAQHAAVKQKGKPAVLYLFEPSLKEVARFFEKEIFASLFQQLVEESHLAKFASRMYLLDNATRRIRDIAAVTELNRQRAIHQIQNKKQLEVVYSRIAIGV